MVDFNITRFGNSLSKDRYTIDLEKKVFSSESDYLVLDFNGCSGWTFKANGNCTFITGSDCTFHTDSNCIFNTIADCTFNTVADCTFHTGTYCTFNTKGGCTFSIWGINTCKFKGYNYGSSIIIDRKDNEAYKLTKEFVQLRKIANG